MVFPSWQILTFALLYVFPSLLHWPIIFPVISPPILILWHLWSSKVKNYTYSANFDSEPTCSLQNARKTECNILSFAHRLESCPYFRSFTIFQMYKKMLNGRKLKLVKSSFSAYCKHNLSLHTFRICPYAQHHQYNSRAGYAQKCHVMIHSRFEGRILIVIQTSKGLLHFSNKLSCTTLVFL